MHMSPRENPSGLTGLRSLLQQAYELAEYARSRFDTAPIALAERHHPGHVEHDKQFCQRRNALKSDIRTLLDTYGDSLEYHRFISRLERSLPTVPPDKVPGWSGLLRCRCWWDARDELLEIANYLDELISETESGQKTRIRAQKDTMQKTVTFMKCAPRRDFYTDNLECWFQFSVIDSSLIGTPRERGSVHTVKVEITDQLMNEWGLAGAEGSSVTEDMVKVAYQVAEEYITKQLKMGPLPQEVPHLFLSTKNTDKFGPYNLSNILYPDISTFMVDLDNQLNQSLKKCFEDFADYIESEMRMRFWQSSKAKKGYEWISRPEQLAKDLLLTFLNGRFGDSLYTFEEIKSGAGKIDIFVISPSGEKVVAEVKMCGHRYSATYAQEGLEQLVHYMRNKNTQNGYLMIFDSRVRDFSRGFNEGIETVDKMTITTTIVDLRPYVKQKDAPSDV